MYTNNATNEIIGNVKMGKHIYIDWKSNLKFIMRNDYIETNRCELGIGRLRSGDLHFFFGPIICLEFLKNDAGGWEFNCKSTSLSAFPI